MNFFCICMYKERGESPTHVPWGFSYTLFLTISICTFAVCVVRPHAAGVMEPGLWMDRRRNGSASLTFASVLLDLGFLSFGSHCSDTVGGHTPKCPYQRHPKKVGVVSCRKKFNFISVSMPTAPLECAAYQAAWRSLLKNSALDTSVASCSGYGTNYTSKTSSIRKCFAWNSFW